MQNIGFSKIGGYLFGGPNNKDYSILGSILGYRNFGKLPYRYLPHHRKDVHILERARETEAEAETEREKEGKRKRKKRRDRESEGEGPLTTGLCKSNPYSKDSIMPDALLNGIPSIMSSLCGLCSVCALLWAPSFRY